MNQDQLDRMNDKILALNENHFDDIEDEEKEDEWNSESANIAEDEMMDERNGF